jgi:ubiquitin-conjugating enzyme E2 S
MANPPSLGTMITKIFHPNISKTGEICVDTLKKGWKREYGIGHVLVVGSTAPSSPRPI